MDRKIVEGNIIELSSVLHMYVYIGQREDGLTIKAYRGFLVSMWCYFNVFFKRNLSEM